jgi:mannose-6-phosphate isomerase-like protein (cupin superfamily)
VKEKLVHHDLFGGRGKVTVELELEREPGGFECVLRCTLAPRAHVGVHEQEQSDELVIVLSGSGRAHVARDLPPAASPMGPACMPAPEMTVTRLKPGVVVPVPLGCRLALVNTSRTAPLRYLIVKAAPKDDGRS